MEVASQGAPVKLAGTTMSPLQMTRWRVFKVRSGQYEGEWAARDYSLTDGFTYDFRAFETHAEALGYVIACLNARRS